MRQVAHKTKLKSIVEIRAGYPFRGAVPDKPESGIANAKVIRLKDVSTDGAMDWDSLAEANLQGRKKPDWLKDGDILFQARGSKSNAYYLREVPENVVCAPHFFQMRVKPSTGINPEFLAWQINQLPIQAYFDKNAGGTVMRHVGRKVLEEMDVVIPAMETQIKVVALANTLAQERLVLQGLIKNGVRTMQGVANNVLLGN